MGRAVGPDRGPALRCGVRARCSRSIHAVATVTFQVDQIVSGVVINLVAIGLARFLSTVFFGQATQSDSGPPHLTPIDIPRLSSLPWGSAEAFTSLSPMVIVAFLLVFPVTYSLYRTRWGLRLRSCGENPEATRALGVAWPAPLPGGHAVGGPGRVRGRVPGVEVNITGAKARRRGSGSSRSPR